MGEDCHTCRVLCVTLGYLARGVQRLFPIPWDVRDISNEAIRLTGPPIAPRRIASADFAACSASSVRGFPVALIEQPPRRCSWKLNFISGLTDSIALSILIASAMTSGPQWSPAKTTMVNEVMIREK
jgi:hypothetical protein